MAGNTAMKFGCLEWNFLLKTWSKPGFVSGFHANTIFPQKKHVLLSLQEITYIFFTEGKPLELSLHMLTLYMMLKYYISAISQFSGKMKLITFIWIQNGRLLKIIRHHAYLTIYKFVFCNHKIKMIHNLIHKIND